MIEGIKITEWVAGRRKKGDEGRVGLTLGRSASRDEGIVVG